MAPWCDSLVDVRSVNSKLSIMASLVRFMFLCSNVRSSEHWPLTCQCHTHKYLSRSLTRFYCRFGEKSCKHGIVGSRNEVVEQNVHVTNVKQSWNWSFGSCRRVDNGDYLHTTFDLCMYVVYVPRFVSWHSIHSLLYFASFADRILANNLKDIVQQLNQTIPSKTSFITCSWRPRNWKLKRSTPVTC